MQKKVSLAFAVDDVRAIGCDTLRASLEDWEASKWQDDCSQLYNDVSKALQFSAYMDDVKIIRKIITKASVRPAPKNHGEQIRLRGECANLEKVTS